MAISQNQPVATGGEGLGHIDPYEAACTDDKCSSAWGGCQLGDGDLQKRWLNGFVSTLR
jgi:hypothetical protein